MAVDMNNPFSQFQKSEGVKPTNSNCLQKSDNKNKPVSKAVIGASLVGLAALASVGIYIATKGRGKVKPQTLVDEVKNPTNNTQLEELQKQAKDLKNKIKNDYLSKKEKSMNEWKASEDSGVNMFQMSIIRKEHVEITKDCDKILDILLTKSEELGHGLNVKKQQGIVNDFSNTVKEKIKELSSDKDWIELRNWRRNHLRMRKDKNLRKQITPDDKARRQLVDEVLLSKINGEPTEKLKNLDLSVEDAIKLIKGDNVEHVLMDLQVKKFGWDYPELGIGQVPDKLRIKDLFQNQGYDKYATAKENVNSWKQQVNLAKKQKSMIQERLTNVAQETRQSDDVKALKELNRQIAELKKQSAK